MFIDAFALKLREIEPLNAIGLRYVTLSSSFVRSSFSRLRSVFRMIRNCEFPEVCFAKVCLTRCALLWVCVEKKYYVLLSFFSGKSLFGPKSGSIYKYCTQKVLLLLHAKDGELCAKHLAQTVSKQRLPSVTLSLLSDYLTRYFHL